MMKLYTIGFTQKTAQEFFTLLKTNHVRRLADIRLRPDGQLAGFAKRDDLPYFLENLADGCTYVHLPLLAPTKEILDGYHGDRNWLHYMVLFEALLDERGIPSGLDRDEFDRLPTCLLCSEPTPEKCHRRLVAERLAGAWPDVEVIHL
jgi:uncharacterized protein (DUF488 family)